MTAEQLISAALAMPKTHAVVTTFTDGIVRRHETRSLATAQNHAISERRKIGRDLISHGDDLGHLAGDIVRVASVEIVPLAG